MAFVLKCMSFNLRVAAACDGVNMFFRRAPRVLEVLEREQPDLVGFQEVTDDMRTWLTEHLRGYTLQGCGRERNCHGESMLLGYRTGVCELLALENRWLSPTPDVPGSTFGGDQSSCPRMVTAVLLRHNGSEQPFRFLNTHLDHVGAQARYLGAMEIVQRIAAWRGLQRTAGRAGDPADYCGACRARRRGLHRRTARHLPRLRQAAAGEARADRLYLYGRQVP